MIKPTTVGSNSDTGKFMSQGPRSFAEATLTSHNEENDFAYGSNNYSASMYGKGNDDFHHHSSGLDDFPVLPNGNGVEYNNNNNMYGFGQVGERRRLEKNAQRSIQFANLHESTTHADLVDAVRGGMLLDIFLRNDRSASISFVEESDAQDFFRHVKRNDLYIRGKRV